MSNPYEPPKTDSKPKWDRGVKYTKSIIDWSDFFFATICVTLAAFSPPLVHWLTIIFKDIFPNV